MGKVRVELRNGLFFEVEGKPGEGCFITSNFKDEMDEAEVSDGAEAKAALDGAESLILSLYSEGFDVSTRPFIHAVENTLQAIENHYSL